MTETIEFEKHCKDDYHGIDGKPLPKDILADITQFQVGLSKYNNQWNLAPVLFFDVLKLHNLYIEWYSFIPSEFYVVSA